MRLTNRFVRVFQWIAPVLLPAFVVFGRGLMGAPLGWMAAIGLFIAPLVTIAMYVSAIVFIFDRDAAAAKTSRLAYDVSSYVLWVSMIGLGLTLQDGGDVGPYGSALSHLGVLSDDATVAAAAVFVIMAIGAWLATLITAIVCVVHSRRISRPISVR